jgi:probable F420-dependent oxidoreductase
MGYTHLLAYDHVLGANVAVRPEGRGAYDIDDPFHEILVLFGFLAGQTTTLELVSGIVILPQRQTVLVAKQAAEVDILSQGRMRLGIGVGWNPVEFEGLGKSFEDRGVRSEEQINLMRALWTMKELNFEGRWEQVIGAGINPLPVQRPIPVWIGGYANTTLRRVGRLGDGWFPWREPDDTMRAAIDVIHETALAAGRDPDQIGLEPQLTLAQKHTPAEWLAYTEGWRGLGATHLCVNTMRCGFASPDEHLAALTRVAETLGVAPR